MKILVINGPNLNLLGTREPDIYGAESLAEIQAYTQNCLGDKAQLEWWQSNSESEIIDKVQSVITSDFDALIINPAAYSHTSIAILDALKNLKIPIVEVHLSNIYNRESFRHSLLTAQASSIIMSGLGKDSYYYAALALLRK
ncbi:MAG: 3-dehydroquinate dehydratase [Halobacteriovoraceae bacterium]|nr:3-dehydroquinate dehydratase [Halobacteriovoraceae bacterium]